MMSVTSDKERKKSLQKHANVSRDLDFEFKIKSKNTTNDTNDIFRIIKHDSEGFRYKVQYISNRYNSCNLDLNYI